MQRENIKNILLEVFSNNYSIYPDSLRFSGGLTFFILKNSYEKYLGVMGPEKMVSESGFKDQAGNDISVDIVGKYIIKIFKRSSENLKILLDIFPELHPIPLGINTTFGFGDRLGLAGPAHIRIIEKQKGILPVPSQQSVRELSKTGKDFKTVISQSIWNIIQEGYKGKWGADADHIKEKEYFIKAVEAGMTMYTLDTSQHLDEAVLSMTGTMIKENYWLDTDYIRSIKKEYQDKKIVINSCKLYFSEDTIIRLALVYGKALKFTEEIFQFLSGKLGTFDYEISFDETNTITTPEAHYFIVNEMRRSNIVFTSLALRYPGTFEKGIDYIGNVREFNKSINIHGLISRNLGGYKLSLHSGSDKLSIYPSFARNTQGVFHIKTSGTSWLEAVRLVASVDPLFFRKLFRIAVDTFDENKKAYHVNLDKSALPITIKNIDDKKLPFMLDDRNLRRVFHIAYGMILEKEKEQLMRLLFENEEKHYDYLLTNFQKHFNALGY